MAGHAHDYTDATPWPSRFLRFALASVDVFRGVTMAAMVIVNTPGDWSHVYPPLLHAEWHGWTPTDLIFPVLRLHRRRVDRAVEPQRRISRRDLRGAPRCSTRSASAWRCIPSFNFATVRVMGVLPRLALCYFVAALVFRGVAARPDPSVCAAFSPRQARYSSATGRC